MSSPLVSIVFPTYNRPEEVNHSILFFRKNLKIPYEVIIIDNSESSVDYDLDDNEHYFFLNQNLGTYSRNIGIEKAVAPYLLMLDDDSHPMPGALEKALKSLEQADESVGGITARVERPDGGIESPPLLPTAFHGCGALFRTKALKKMTDFYPDHFCFYGEEYFSTLMFYQASYHFKYMDEFIVCHRMSSAGRDKAKILYHLSLNNRRTWMPYVPEAYLEKAMFDTQKRYELISAKENVFDAYEKAMTESFTMPDIHKMTDKQFEDFALITELNELIESGKIDKGRGVLLCSCGKFPTLWAGILEKKLDCKVEIADFNSGLIDQQYGAYHILPPEKVEALVKQQDYLPLVGHSARLDTYNWKTMFHNLTIDYLQINVGDLFQNKQED